MFHGSQGWLGLHPDQTCHRKCHQGSVKKVVQKSVGTTSGGGTKIHLQYMYNTSAVHLQYIYNTCTIHLQYICNTSTIHLQYIYNTSAIHLQYIYNTSTMPLQYICNTSTIHLQYIYNTSTMPLQYICNTSAIHLQHLYDTSKSDNLAFTVLNTRLRKDNVFSGGRWASPLAQGAGHARVGRSRGACAACGNELRAGEARPAKRTFVGTRSITENRLYPEGRGNYCKQSIPKHTNSKR